MEIKRECFYTIAKIVNGKAVEYFNNRIYLGRFVMLAYNQIPNKEEYSICTIKCSAIKEKEPKNN